MEVASGHGKIHLWNLRGKPSRPRQLGNPRGKSSRTRQTRGPARDQILPTRAFRFFYFHSSGDCLHIISILWGSSWDELIPPQSYFKALLHCVIFSATCLTMFENVALQVGEVGCYTTARSQQLAIFLALFSYQERKTRSVRMRPC